MEIIGEATRHISRTFQDDHAEVAWRGIVAQGHVLAHEYGAVQPDKIRRVATIHIPNQIAQLAPFAPDC